MFTRKELTEWTSALRANPEQQLTGQLANSDYTKFCCLGKMCEIRGVKRKRGPDFNGYRDGSTVIGTVLPVDLAREFTGESDNCVGNFYKLGMPMLKEYLTAAHANDKGCTWIEIADHFDKYYPCSDEPNSYKGV